MYCFNVKVCCNVLDAKINCLEDLFIGRLTGNVWINIRLIFCWPKRSWFYNVNNCFGFTSKIVLSSII